MCGIAGKISFYRDPAGANAVERMTRSLTHRGPDCLHLWASYHAQQTLHFGHALLAITGTPLEGKQPMSKHGLTICFNGEIHNHQELAKELDRSPNGPTDTELLLDAWEKWGAAVLNRLNGMWAFALYDSRNHTTTLCRDRYGIKPLFLNRTPREITFASEVGTVDIGTGFSLNPNPHHYHALRGLNTRQEHWLEGVEEIKPGHLLEITPDGSCREIQWHKPERPEVPQNIREQGEALLQLLGDACRIRQNGANAALCLSGGIDSSTIAALLCQGSQKPRRVFHISFPGAPNDESQKADVVARMLQLSVTTTVVSRIQPDELETILGSTDGPMATPDFLPIWKLHQTLNKQGHKVAIDGMGADELLGGYFLGNEAMKQAWANRCLQQGLEFWNAFRPTYPQAGRWMLGELKRLALGKSEGNKTAVEDELTRQFHSTVLPYLLHQYDRMSMAHGIETRMPFLDHRIVDFCQNLPTTSKIGGGKTKRVLREAATKLLPKAIVQQKRKIGFTAPAQHWMTGWLKEWVLDTAHSEKFLSHPGFDGKTLRKEVELAAEGAPTAATQREIWAALHTTWWLQNKAALRQ